VKNTRIHLTALGGCLLVSFSALSQGTFLFDQQSATNTGFVNGDGGLVFDLAQPAGQSFTPTLSSVDLVQFKFFDTGQGSRAGATVYVDLLSGSITGNVIAASSPVTMPRLFFGITNFYSPTGTAVTPGTTYYFQPVLAAGNDQWTIIDNPNYNYPGGSGFAFGSPQSSQLWFREGVIIPEPSLSLLLVLGCISMAVRRPGRAKPHL
jgi:hypothetical protein